MRHLRLQSKRSRAQGGMGKAKPARACHKGCLTTSWAEFCKICIGGSRGGPICYSSGVREYSNLCCSGWQICNHFLIDWASLDRAHSDNGLSAKMNFPASDDLSLKRWSGSVHLMSKPSFINTGSGGAATLHKIKEKMCRWEINSPLFIPLHCIALWSGLYIN